MMINNVVVLYLVTLNCFSGKNLLREREREGGRRSRGVEEKNVRIQKSLKFLNETSSE